MYCAIGGPRQLLHLHWHPVLRISRYWLHVPRDVNLHMVPARPVPPALPTAAIPHPTATSRLRTKCTHPRTCPKFPLHTYRQHGEHCQAVLPLLPSQNLALTQPSQLLHFKATVRPIASKKLRSRIYINRSTRSLQFIASGPCRWQPCTMQGWPRAVPVIHRPSHGNGPAAVRNTRPVPALACRRTAVMCASLSYATCTPTHAPTATNATHTTRSYVPIGPSALLKYTACTTACTRAPCLHTLPRGLRTQKQQHANLRTLKWCTAPLPIVTIIATAAGTARCSWHPRRWPRPGCRTFQTASRCSTAWARTAPCPGRTRTSKAVRREAARRLGGTRHGWKGEQPKSGQASRESTPALLGHGMPEVKEPERA